MITKSRRHRKYFREEKDNSLLTALNNYMKCILKKRNRVIGTVLASLLMSIILNIYFVEEIYITKTIIEISPFEGEVLEDSEKYDKFIRRYAPKIENIESVNWALSKAGIYADTKEVLKNLDVKINVNTDTFEVIYSSNSQIAGININRAIVNDFNDRHQRLVDRGNIKIVKDTFVFGEAPLTNIYIASIVTSFLSIIMIVFFYIVFTEVRVGLRKISENCERNCVDNNE